jgi:integrase
MANITKRGNAYRIRVSCGYGTDGKQRMSAKTWVPPDGMTAKQAEKEALRQAVLFEDACKGGASFTSVKLGTFMEQWFEEYAKIKLKEQTIRGYKCAQKRVAAELGHMRIDKIMTRDIQKFVGTLVGEKLSAKSVKNHISFISTVFSYAKKMKMVSENPCKDVTLPKNDSKRRGMYTQEEAQQFIKLLMSEPEDSFQYIICYILAIYTGFRRGELLGLEWKDFNDGLVSVRQAAYYSPAKGNYTDKPKTKSSMQTQKLPNEIWQLLQKYRSYQAHYASSLGDKWVDTDRLFTAWNGETINCNAPLIFLKRFCSRHGLRQVTLHSFRHLYASLLINAGLDVKTVQSSLRHTSATTTLDIYAHEFQTAQARASKAVADALNLKI